MRGLIVAAAFFLLIHFGIAGSRLRDVLVARLGEKTFRGLFALLSAAGLAWLIFAYRRAPLETLWLAPRPLAHSAFGLVLLAFLLAVPGLLTPNPTAAGREPRLESSDAVQGIVRVTRHPFLWGTALWALAHLLANGDLASVVFFGSLLLLALAGTFSIDAKRRRHFGASWNAFERATSNVPFGAIAAGRNRLAIGEIGAWRLLAALAAYAVVLAFHATWFGVNPLP